MTNCNPLFTEHVAVYNNPLLFDLKANMMPCQVVHTEQRKPIVVEKEVIKEVIKEVPVEVIKEVEVVKEVPVEVVKEVIKEVPVEVIKTDSISQLIKGVVMEANIETNQANELVETQKLESIQKIQSKLESIMGFFQSMVVQRDSGHGKISCFNVSQW